MAASAQDSTTGVHGAPATAIGPGPDGEDYEEISLVDIVRVLHRRRVVLAVVLALALLGGGALTYFTAPEYSARASLIPLEHELIIQNWLGSRQAAEVVLDRVGSPLYEELMAERWDESAEAWVGVPPSSTELAEELVEHVKVSALSQSSRTITITASFGDGTLARDVASAYLGALDALRPQLENLTRSELFDTYYDGTNAQEAQRRAETAAREKSYWLVFDEPALPTEPVKPRPVLNMALAGVLGIVGGVMLVFGLEWVSKYRAEIARQPPT